MKQICILLVTLVATAFAHLPAACAGQAPGASSDPNVPISHHDRVYASEQFSNTVSIIDPVDNHLIGVIRLGDPSPGNFSPLYKGQVLVHGMGYSPDHRTLAIVAIGSNSVTFIDTTTNAIKHTTYVGRSPHEAFYTPDGREVWVTVRGENYIDVLDAGTYAEKTRIVTPAGPGMTIFSTDGKYGYVCSSFNPEVDVITVADHQIVAKVTQDSPFCPNIAATPDGKQVWFTLKDIGKTQVFDAHPPFSLIKTLDTGPITNHVNFAVNSKGSFAYITVGGLNAVKVFRTDTFAQVATIPVGNMPHGVWPSGDGSRIYVGLENSDTMTAIDTRTNKVIAVVPIGQAPQAIAYVSNAVPEGDGTQNMQPLGVAGQAAHLSMVGVDHADAAAAPTSVVLYEQGVVQVLQASVTGLQPKQPYVLGLSGSADGSGPVEPLARFMTNPAGSAIVDAIGQIRQVVAPGPTEISPEGVTRRYLVIAPTVEGKTGNAVQVQSL
ncbi:40-residue YVTN family beta-propeller repeat-containing protein [Paraburkholderia fungorum]|uniref:40-residue YVTN family beta-propeller repeat-containing protein n=1 Tax=Paraburkholderia fungorum TaxID=134537 RepID=A0A1H1H5L2_9BURK|nr:YncE family protein [Paraburkholderia fungorum]SDR20772.1 40-residue YVTN family beta-propeller repeat-containing protein [Paraburkholderia fungorum]